MSSTYVGTLAGFASGAAEAQLPDDILGETKRLILDSVGCALASPATDAGRIGIEYAQILGGSSSDCHIIGSSHRSSLHGAAFANTELIASLDMAPLNAPAHVLPYVVPAAFAFGELGQATGARIVAAVAAGLEITSRFSQSMDNNREVVDGRPQLSRVMGFSTSIFGTTAAAAIVKGTARPVIEHALAIAAGTTPVNALRAWQMHVLNSSVKYNLGGGLTLAAINALYMAELGHRGDLQVLDDPEFGYPRFIATKRWEPENLVDGLGQDWRFPSGTHYKPYPHCRVTHALFDLVYELVRSHDIQPEDIESLTAYGEEWATGLPTYMNREIERPYDGQFSFAHGLAIAAHQVPPGRDWQDPAVVYAPSVLDVMSRVIWKAHPDWAAAYSKDPSARPSRVEIVAKGTTFAADRSYPKGTASPDPTTYMTTDELVVKFRHNASAVLDEATTERLIGGLLTLETLPSITPMLELMRPPVISVARHPAMGRRQHETDVVRAVGVRNFGGPEQLEIITRPAPRPGSGCIVVDVAAATINPTDILLRSGAQRASLPVRGPYVPGMEFAGFVREVARDVAGIRPGQRVMGVVDPRRVEGGAQAEQIVVPTRWITPLSDDADLIAAATVPMNGLTALEALDLVGLEPGQSLLVTGAAGAVGGFVVQLAKARGLRVFADANDADRELVEGLGADVVVPRGEQMAPAVRRLAGEGVDAVVDAALIGTPATDLVRSGGRWAALRRDQVSSTPGVTRHVVSVSERLDDSEALRELAEAFQDGRLITRVAHVLPATEAAEGHRLVEAGGLRGRVVLTFARSDDDRTESAP